MPLYFKRTTAPHGQGLIIDEETGRTVAVVYDQDDGNGPKFAAVDDLIDALSDILVGVNELRRPGYDKDAPYGIRWDRSIDKAVAALAKARGEA